VLRCGGEILSADEMDEVGEARFYVVHCRGIGTLAPFAKVDPALAVLLWLEHTGSTDGSHANHLLARLRAADRPIFAIKQGLIAGPPDRPGCIEVQSDVIETALDAATAGSVAWELDPDFGYEVPATVPGLEEGDSRALLPRLIYADHDRVYEHAGLVAAKKRERHLQGAAIEGLDRSILDASGWPPEAAEGSSRR
jgi:hypothetical protein